MPSPVRSFQGRALGPATVRVPGATITPASIDPAAATFVGAVYGAEGGLVPASLRPAWLGHFRPVDPLSIDRAAPAAAHHPEAIFAGHVFHDWGHFLFETLSTAWAGATLPDCPVLFAPFARPAGAGTIRQRLLTWAGLLDAAGWGTRPLLALGDTTRVDVLHVPERLSVFGAPFRQPAMHPALREVYARIVARFGEAGPRVPMVARRPAGHGRLHPQEERFYAVMAEHGFRIVDGAALAPEAQVALFSRASVLAGFSGSNLHNSVFAPPGTPVVEITDSRSHGRPERRNRTQLAICDLLEQPYRILDGFGGAPPGEPIAAEALVAAARDAAQPASF